MRIDGFAPAFEIEDFLVPDVQELAAGFHDEESGVLPVVLPERFEHG